MTDIQLLTLAIAALLIGGIVGNHKINKLQRDILCLKIRLTLVEADRKQKDQNG